MQSAPKRPRFSASFEPLFPPDDGPSSRYRVHVCRGPNCSARGSAATLACFEEEVHRQGLDREVEILATSCRDRCDYGPSVNVFPGQVRYAEVDCERARRIVEQHLAGDLPVAELRFDDSKPGRSR